MPENSTPDPHMTLGNMRANGVGMRKIMATRQHRISEFDQGLPPAGQSLELLCEDHSGTYLLPYLCNWKDGAWCNSAIGAAIEGKVIGWRVPYMDIGKYAKMAPPPASPLRRKRKAVS
jgi:hypothetical protein